MDEIKVMEEDKSISLKSISEIIKVSTNTLRKWSDANHFIKKAKIIQSEERLVKKVDSIYIQIDRYISNFTGDKIESRLHV